MEPRRHRRRPGALFAACAALGTPLAGAQGYPEKPVRMIVPFAPGGNADILLAPATPFRQLHFERQAHLLAAVLRALDR